MRALALIAAIALSAPAASSAARPGTLDPSFGGDGRVTTNVAGGGPTLAGIETLAGGKLLLAGTVGDRKIVLIRYRRDGTLDRRFGHKGVRSYGFDRDVVADDMAIDGEGRILVVGALGGDALVLRFDRAGRADSTFDGDGIALVDFGGADDATALAVAPDGRIVITAAIRLSDSGDLGVARLDASGHVEAGFGESGFVQLRHHNSEDHVSPVAVAVFPDNRLAVGVNYSSPKGNAPFAFRLAANGAPDAAFGQDVGVPGWQNLRGLTGIDEAYAADLALLPRTGHLLATGSGFPAARNMSLWLAGADPPAARGVISLGRDEVWGTRLAFDGAGRTLVAGSTHLEKALGGFETAELRDMVVARFGRDGQPTSCFGRGGAARVRFAGRKSIAAGLAVQPGRVVVAGSAPSNFQLARLHNGRC
jgi:uncharacterized delta-60 repeat protein